MTATLTYSLIIVTYRRHQPLCDTLRAITPLIDPGQGEVIVVDQCPPGPLPPDVLDVPGLRYIAPHVPGMVRARNMGINEARGQIVLFLDDDVIPLPGLIAGHLSAYADPAVGGVAGRILDPGQEAEIPLADPRSFDPLCGWEYAQFDHVTPGDVMTARGCNMSFRRELLLKLGGFDVALFPPFSFREDSDMSFRIRAAGYKIRFVPAAALIHLNAPSGGTRELKAPDSRLTAEWKQYRALLSHQTNNLYFILRHFSSKARWVNVWKAYRSYVGLSRWPWRLAAKNVVFLAALWHAAELVRYRRYHPCSLDD